MPSETPAAEAKDDRMMEMLFSQHEKRCSPQNNSRLCNERFLFPSGIKNVDLLEKVGALKTEKLPRQTAKDRQGVKKNSVSSPLGNSQKPWPSRKGPGFDEPVMNMSSVPFYLQRLEEGDNIHGKALNFGVLDWGRLERWTNHQKCVTDVGGGRSACNSTQSSAIAAFGSFNQSRKTISSPLSRGKKSPVFPHKRSPVTGSRSEMYEGEDSGHIQGIRSLRISSTKFPTQNDNGDFVPSAKLLGNKHDKGNSKDSDLKAISGEVCLPRHSAASPSRYKIDTATAIATANGVAEDQNESSMKAEKCIDNGHSQSLDSNFPQISQDCNRIADYPRENMDGGCLSSDSPLTADDWLAEGNGYNYSGNLAEDVKIIHQYLHVPHPCPLPCTIQDDEPDISCTVLSEGVAPTDKLVFRNGENDLLSKGTCEQLEVNTTEGSTKSEKKMVSAAGRESSNCSMSADLKSMSKSSSSREGSSEEQIGSVSHLFNSHGDQAARKNKSRQSPLRRILDPIMKPKNNLSSTGPIAALSGSHRSCELSRTDKSNHGVHKPSSVDSTRQVRGNMITSNQLSNNDKGTQKDEKHVAPMKQALLQVAWKNGLPLFMLSSCDSEVFAAAITMRSIISNYNNLECIYKIFSVNGSKKKAMFWSSPGNKGKKHQLISNVVGQLKVSLGNLRSHEGDSSHATREFVLLGAEQATVDSSTMSELAAIVVKVPPHMDKSDTPTRAGHSSCGANLSTRNVSASNDEKRLQTDQHNDDQCQSGISVMLPSGVHGLSTDGEPSPLIERWRSGGACDCGGWDEGCSLTVLTDKSRKCSNFGTDQDCQTTDGTHRSELFIQGGSQEKRLAFSIVPFREGLYTVEFRSSISMLQSLAICMAVLHGRKTTSPSTEPKILQEHTVNDQLGKAPAGAQGGDPNSYVPNHPPLSPVGRA
ncbi:hypothetical protein MUK42_32733 [Musa troglodytarum]|uniref:Uncharacterized protein n=1 Tax=Musa troglodytarum TaxID=320322 RepID=A0A9E7LAC8_9LILI|nr:hypothetical protein MUK42_32733 [Musa troglodytarum]